MDFNLNNLSSNLMLIALILVGLCCLYLLYSNFTKVREIEELKRRVHDLKTIFLNQQMHNDETFSKLNTVIFQSLTNGNNQNVNSSSNSSANMGLNLHTLDINNEIAKEVSAELRQNIPTNENITKTININIESTLEGTMDTNNIIINKEGYPLEEVNSTIETRNTEAGNSSSDKDVECKEINIDLHDLDNLDDVNDIDDDIDDDANNALDINLDECEEIDVDKYETKSKNIDDDNIDVQITKDNLFDVDTVNITNAEIFDDLEDTLSIATAPIDESNDIINHNGNFNLEDIQDIQDMQDDDTLEPIDINVKTVHLDGTNPTNSRNEHNDNEKLLDLNELLNGNTNVSHDKNTKNKQANNELAVEKEPAASQEHENETAKTDYNSLSVKQLKDIAKSYGLKATGNKQELIQILQTKDAKYF